MDIPIDVEVFCTDGPGGHSSAIVLNPVTKEVTHFAVRTKGFLSDEYLVPVELIAESTPARISLSCSRAELAQCQPFEKTVLVGVDGAELGASDMDYAAGLDLRHDARRGVSRADDARRPSRKSSSPRASSACTPARA